jgi:hypothetical protein
MNDVCTGCPGFTNKQPGACLRSSDVMKDHDHVVLGDDPADIGPEVREGLQESARGSDDRGIGCELL